MADITDDVSGKKDISKAILIHLSSKAVSRTELRQNGLCVSFRDMSSYPFVRAPYSSIANSSRTTPFVQPKPISLLL